MRWTAWVALVLGCAFACDFEDADEPTQVPVEDAVDMLVDGFCERQFGCDCLSPRYEDVFACADAAEMWVDQVRALGESLGLEYRPECIGSWLDRVAAVGCTPPAEQQQACVRSCAPYVGTRRAGAPCEYLGNGVSECAAGLACVSSSCVDPCEGWRPDGTVGAGGSCAQRSCADDLYCNESLTCVALPGVGAPCPNGACVGSASCRQVDPNDPSYFECVALAADGEPCMGHGECRSGYCPAAFCAPLPKAGESCRGTSVCAEGLTCFDDTCRPEDAEVCSLSIPPDAL